MIRRCLNPDAVGYENYGGRGVKICENWRDVQGFERFVEDMGKRPQGKSLDRIDPYKNYSCGHCPQCLLEGWIANCKWSTSKQQANNQRRHHAPPTPEQVAALAANAAVEAHFNEVVF